MYGWHVFFSDTDVGSDEWIQFGVKDVPSVETSLIFHTNTTIPPDSRLHGWRLMLQPQLIVPGGGSYSIDLQIWRTANVEKKHFVLVYERTLTLFPFNIPRGVYTEIETREINLTPGDVVGVRIHGVTPLVIVDNLVCNDTQVYAIGGDVNIGYTYLAEARDCIGFVLQLLHKPGNTCKIQTYLNVVWYLQNCCLLICYSKLYDKKYNTS